MLKKQSPRELSKKFGYSSLSQEELWALVLRTGTQHVSVFAMSDRLAPLVAEELEKESSTKAFQNLLTAETSWGKIQRYSILAMYELLLRQRVKKEHMTSFTKPSQLVEQFTFLQAKRQEFVYGVYLSPRMTIIHKELLTKGTTDSVIIDVRDVLYFGIKHRVRHFILVHNHPTGDPSPSSEDIEQTKRIVEAAKLFSMVFVDHIIIGKGCYFSFKESTSVL